MTIPSRTRADRNRTRRSIELQDALHVGVFGIFRAGRPGGGFRHGDVTRGRSSSTAVEFVAQPLDPSGGSIEPGVGEGGIWTQCHNHAGCEDVNGVLKFPAIV